MTEAEKQLYRFGLCSRRIDWDSKRWLVTCFGLLELIGGDESWKAKGQLRRFRDMNQLDKVHLSGVIRRQGGPPTKEQTIPLTIEQRRDALRQAAPWFRGQELRRKETETK